MISTAPKPKKISQGTRNLELLIAYQSENDPAVKRKLRNRVIELNLGLVRRMSIKLSNNWQDETELYSEGCLALMDAVEKFDPERGFQFSTYATTCIRNRLYRLFKNRNRGPIFLSIDEEVQAVSNSSEEITFLDDSRKTVQTILRELSDRERELIELRFGLDDQRKPRSYRQVAEQVGLSKERVRQLVQQAILTIQTELVMSPGGTI
ncbi:MAG: sigma-70 family RNA polymerase sigma factor [Planctomycetaceae bacterium]|nr:sigma-70 family RNA polymerase sigma factor [Planctomycetaceae bacterium]MDC0308243.1 sigma-70 family RNA polymerase sigma factor [Planctomycetaceae bacterium]MDG2390738.1 sigma-70 family RNA polymerase sigma factor [Planctomycetaceae bacterium]